MPRPSGASPRRCCGSIMGRPRLSGRYIVVARLSDSSSISWGSGPRLQDCDSRELTTSFGVHQISARRQLANPGYLSPMGRACYGPRGPWLVADPPPAMPSRPSRASRDAACHCSQASGWSHGRPPQQRSARPPRRPTGAAEFPQRVNPPARDVAEVQATAELECTPCVRIMKPPRRSNRNCAAPTGPRERQWSAARGRASASRSRGSAVR